MSENAEPLATVPDSGEIGYRIEEVKESAKADLDFLAALSMPDDATLAFPNLYVQLFQLLTSALLAVRDFSKFAIGLPRGHGKTMFLKLLVCYIIFFTDRKFILIIGASDDLAQNILSDVIDILDSQNIQQVFGNWRYNLEVDRKDFKKFTFNGRPVILRSAGQGTSIRGINVKNARPDVIICDDAQTADSAASVAESERFQKWFLGTLMKAKAPTGCTYIYVGNMYADLQIVPGRYGCMLRNLQFSPDWTSYIVGGILADGKALWEELQPLEQLMAEFRQDLALGRPEIFFAEVLNDPQAMASTALDVSKLGVKHPMRGELHQGNFIIIDPSNDKKKSDETAIGYFELYDGAACFMDLINEKLSPQDTIYKVLKMCIDKQCPLVFVESNAYQYSLMSWFQFICEQQKIEGISFEPLYSNGISKNSKILQMFKTMMAGDILLGEAVRSRFIIQASRFNPKVKDNQDDILDVVAMTDQVLSNYRHLLIEAGADRFVIDAEFSSVPSVDESAETLF